MSVDVLVAGAGFAGATSARVIADAGFRVHVVERRPLTGGNACEITDPWGSPHPSARRPHLPHQLGPDYCISVALHRLARVRAPRAGRRWGRTSFPFR